MPDHPTMPVVAVPAREDPPWGRFACHYTPGDTAYEPGPLVTGAQVRAGQDTTTKETR